MPIRRGILSALDRRTETYDAIIAGAGPAGLAAALSLGGASLQRPARVLLIDPRDPRKYAAEGGDTRGSALTLATQSMLQALGCWDHLAPHAAEMRDIIVTDGKGPLDRRPVLLSFATAQDRRAAAAIVENRHLAQALIAAVEGSPCIALNTGSAIAEVAVSGGFAQVKTENGDSLRAPLLIGADGRNSFLRRSAGIAVDLHDHGQTALTFSLVHEHPHHDRAEEHFSPDGVFALLPLPGCRSSVVWGTSRAEAARLMALAPDDFERELNGRVGAHLGFVRVEGAKQAFPLQLQIARAMTSRRIALVGDAAHTIHPLAGLGLNLGFKDVACLADCVSEAIARGEDHGGASVMERYARWRRFDIAATVLAMEGLNHLFANDWPVLRIPRDLGLRAVDHLAGVKHALMQEASGTTGTLPRLMRGIRS